MNGPYDRCLDCGEPKKWKWAPRCKPCSMRGERNPMHGRVHSEETRAKIAMKAARPRPERRGELHPMWKGSAATAQSGRDRAVNLFPDREPCEKCGAVNAERHHIDGNTLNNCRGNIAFLCRPHHREIHPGHGRIPLKPYVREVS